MITAALVLMMMNVVVSFVAAFKATRIPRTPPTPGNTRVLDPAFMSTYRLMTLALMSGIAGIALYVYVYPQVWPILALFALMACGMGYAWYRTSTVK